MSSRQKKLVLVLLVILAAAFISDSRDKSAKSIQTGVSSTAQQEETEPIIDFPSIDFMGAMYGITKINPFDPHKLSTDNGGGGRLTYQAFEWVKANPNVRYMKKYFIPIECNWTTSPGWVSFSCLTPFLFLPFLFRVSGEI